MIFYGAHLPYSPTTLGVFYFLESQGHDVHLLVNEPDPHYSLRKVNHHRVHYLSPHDDPQVEKKTDALLTPLAKSYISAISAMKADIVIAIDFFSLWCAQRANERAHLLSLEIWDNDEYLAACDLENVHSVIIQSQERYDYIFRNGIRPAFSILPNSPHFDDFVPAYSSRQKTDLIYCGSAVAEFGIFSCLDFLVDYPEYRLTVQGAIPVHVRESIDKFYPSLGSDRLVMNDIYLEPAELTQYVSRFRVGFAFYDVFRFPILRQFNYYTSPAGKLFQYFNSGVPVVANKLPCFELIENKGAGQMVSCLSSLEIKRAVDIIENSYLLTAQNSKNISHEFDFGSFLAPALRKLWTPFTGHST